MEDFKLDDFLDGDSTELDFDLGDFDFTDIDDTNSRHIKPRFSKVPIKVNYSYARDMAKDIKLTRGEQIHAIVGGNFVFGDLLEALLVEKKVIADEMFVSTLSLSQENVDSFKTILDLGYCKKLNLVISNYFYSHERTNLVKYMLDELDTKDDNFDLAVCRSHTKIVLIKIGETYIVMSGSANLRSSRSIEQIIIQEDKDLYEFYKGWFLDKNTEYGIINHKVVIDG